MGSLRLSLALFVVFFHAQAYTVFEQGLPPFETWLPVPDGRTAVQMFYLISGFYMALVLNEKYKTADTNWLFYTNRFMRLWPAAFIVNLLVILSFLAMDEVRLFGLTTSPEAFWALLTSLDPAALGFVVFSNLFVVGQDVLWFFRFDPSGMSIAPFGSEVHNGSSLSLNHPLFTVAIEAFYYAISPFVLRRGWKVALGFVVVGGLWHVGIAATGARNVIWGYHFVASAAYFYFFGACAYHLYRLVEQEPVRGWLETRHGLAWTGVGAGICVLLAVYYVMPRATLFMAPVMAIVVPLLFVLTRYRRTDRMIGELSFGVYLAHYPILMVLAPLVTPMGLWLWTTALSIAAALLLFFLVDQPLDRWRQRRATASADRSEPKRFAWRRPRGATS